MICWVVTSYIGKGIQMLTSIPRCEVILNFDYHVQFILGQRKKRARANGARLACVNQLGIESLQTLEQYHKILRNRFLFPVTLPLVQ